MSSLQGRMKENESMKRSEKEEIKIDGKPGEKGTIKRHV